jgi:hypothetical protein
MSMEAHGGLGNVYIGSAYEEATRFVMVGKK